MFNVRAEARRRHTCGGIIVIELAGDERAVGSFEEQAASVSNYICKRFTGGCLFSQPAGKRLVWTGHGSFLFFF